MTLLLNYRHVVLPSRGLLLARTVFAPPRLRIEAEEVNMIFAKVCSE